jgi:hypothetical protein
MAVGAPSGGAPAPRCAPAAAGKAGAPPNDKSGQVCQIHSG